MNKTFRNVVLVMCVLVSSAFKPTPDKDYYNNDGTLIAVVNEKNFDLRDKDRYHAELIYKTTAINKGNNIVKHVAVAINFFGNAIKDEKGADFKENVEFEYAFNEGALGEPGDIKLDLNYDRNAYYILQEESKLNVTRVDWSADRRSFTISADFDCVLRKWGYPSYSQPTVRFKGKMENINVTAPSWINIKNPTQEAQTK